MIDRIGCRGWLCLVATCLVAFGGASSWADDEGPKPVAAPPRHAIVGETLNGWYFAPKQLKETYNQALKSLEALQGQVDAGELDANKAKGEFQQLRERLKELRRTIEESRVHVEGAAINEQTETHEFALGPERRLAITGNKIRVVGWEKPHVKAELKKIVLSPDGKPVDDDLKAIAIKHEHARADFAGMTDTEWEVYEADFLAKEGAKLTPAGRAQRQSLVAGIRHGQKVHRDLAGKTIDQLTIRGLDYESNRVINWRVDSKDGDGQWGSVRQRYAELTVYVPACTSVTVRGAARGLVVENLVAGLTIVNEDSTDSDWHARFEVNGLRGNLVCRQFPLFHVTNVTGELDIETTTDDASEGAGTTHHNDMLTLTPGRPNSVLIEEITGAATLHYGRVKLELRQINGVLNVANDFGDTRVVLKDALAAGAHRVYSVAGRIDAELSAAAWASLPLVAASNHGIVRTNVERNELDEFRLRGVDAGDQVTRHWSGFYTKQAKADPLGVFRLIERFAAIAKAGPRDPGLDLFSRAGKVTLLRK